MSDMDCWSDEDCCRSSLGMKQVIHSYGMLRVTNPQNFLYDRTPKIVDTRVEYLGKRESPATISCCFPAARIRCCLSNEGNECAQQSGERAAEWKQQEIVAGDSRLLENFDKASMKPSFAFIEFPHHALT
ncbi:hypothetical protein DdX_15300 [Ditylenchus destructor]|uniref:Uncharacterized protein n=1 Tax=Ditylenchus destructor TaxID=166010 RepID=A0AAD4MVJ5_9BILA|nr:hypothetical protein DdX_15300 [Ditylenchus destructor]